MYIVDFVGLFEVTLPSISGFSAAAINFGLNVAAVGVTLPLQIDGGLVSNSLTNIADGTAAAPSYSFTGDNDTGFYRVSANTLGISTAGVQRVVVSSTGIVGINAPTPAVAAGHGLHIQSNTQATLQLDSTPKTGGISWSIASGSGGLAGQGFLAFYDSTAATERMRLDASGRLTVGQTSPGNNLEIIRINAPGNSVNAMGIVSTDNASNAIYMAFRKSDTTLIGSIRRSGTTDAVVYNTTASDYRLKEEVNSLADGLNKIKALRPVSFKWKQDGRTDVGFIAHELQEVIPECVTGDKDGLDKDGNPDYQSIFPAPAQMIANLVAAIQELSAKNEEQSSRIDALEARLAALEAK